MKRSRLESPGILSYEGLLLLLGFLHDEKRQNPGQVIQSDPFFIP